MFEPSKILLFALGEFYYMGKSGIQVDQLVAGFDVRRLQEPLVFFCYWDYLGTCMGCDKWMGLRNRTGGVTEWLSNANEQRIFLNGQEN